jgi:hypothetical protein
MLLTEDLIEGSRPHPHGERQSGRHRLGQAATDPRRLRSGDLAEQVFAHFSIFARLVAPAVNNARLRHWALAGGPS